MNKLQGEVLILPKISGAVSAPKTFSGNVGAKTINIGKDGATFIPSVSPDGEISWTNDKELPNPEPVNIKGKDGKDGKIPVKGTDYFTEQDKAEMVSTVIAKLPVYDGSVTAV